MEHSALIMMLAPCIVKSLADLSSEEELLRGLVLDKLRSDHRVSGRDLDQRGIISVIQPVTGQ